MRLGSVARGAAWRRGAVRTFTHASPVFARQRPEKKEDKEGSEEAKEADAKKQPANNASKPAANDDGYVTGPFGIKFKVMRGNPNDKLASERQEDFEKMKQKLQKEADEIQKKNGKDPKKVVVYTVEVTPSQFLFVGLGTGLLLTLLLLGGEDSSEISFQKFKTDYLAKGLVSKIVVVNDEIAEVVLHAGAAANGQPTLRVWFGIGTVETFERQLAHAQEELNIGEDFRVPVVYTKETNWGGMLSSILPLMLLLGYLFYLFRRTAGGAGGRNGIFGMSKNTAKRFDPETDITVTFKDVAGMGEAKTEIMEFVKFLKDPAKYEALGAKIPRGAILSGPPGTGKTLIARATAGEAGVPFYSVAGSEFYQMFVGVGALRVRDLFKMARENAPLIVFIDEIDAIGKARLLGQGRGGNDERELTLNQLLVEMDGFELSDHVVVLAGTNRADILDKALMRPGRFDRHIQIDNPEMEGRKEIFEVHLEKLTLAKDLDDKLSGRLAALTPGFSGADIANVCNEAALVAARHGADAVHLKHFELAIERVIGGVEKKSKVLNELERKTVAYHEAGHAVCGWHLQYADPLLKVLIIPRGKGALGYAQYLPPDVYLMLEAQLMDRMVMALGGRMSEVLNFPTITSGASDDLKKVTRMATAMVTQLGMLPKIGFVNFEQQDQEDLTKPFSEETGAVVDAEVRRIIGECRERCREMLTERKHEVELVAEELLRKEAITRDDMVRLLGPRKWAERNDAFEKYIDGKVDSAEAA